VTAPPLQTVALVERSSAEADRFLHAYLAAASRRARRDPEFAVRLRLLGLDLSEISAADEAALARAARSAPVDGGLRFREFWWGFVLEVPEREVTRLTAADTSPEALRLRLGRPPAGVAAHVRTLATFLYGERERVREASAGRGVFVSMSSFAPHLYVVLVRPAATAPSDGESDLGPGSAAPR
jgi:hypothetical protein